MAISECNDMTSTDNRLVWGRRLLLQCGISGCSCCILTLPKEPKDDTTGVADCPVCSTTRPSTLPDSHHDASRLANPIAEPFQNGGGCPSSPNSSRDECRRDVPISRTKMHTSAPPSPARGYRHSPGTARTEVKMCGPRRRATMRLRSWRLATASSAELAGGSALQEA